MECAHCGCLERCGPVESAAHTNTVCPLVICPDATALATTTATAAAAIATVVKEHCGAVASRARCGVRATRVADATVHSAGRADSAMRDARASLFASIDRDTSRHRGDSDHG